MFGVTGIRFISSYAADPSGTVAPMRRYLVWSGYWMLGHLIGGIAVGAALGWTGSFLPEPLRVAALAVLSLLCAIWALAEIRLVDVPMPQWPRQVQRQWLGNVPWNVLAVGWGVQLGSAVATRIKTTTIYAALSCAFLTGSAAAGVAVMAVFSAARALPALVLGPLVASPERSRGFAVRVESYAGTVARANAAILLLAAIWLAWTAGLAATGIDWR